MIGETVLSPFVLRGVDSSHPYLTARGILLKTAVLFGVGFYSGPGLMSGRVVIPIHDASGTLVAYAGRAIDGAVPKYRLPAGLLKSQLLFNFHRAAAVNEPAVVVVEGFFDCIKVHQAGVGSVVALMGTALSDQGQQLLLQRHLDAGRGCCRAARRRGDCRPTGRQMCRPGADSAGE